MNNRTKKWLVPCIAGGVINGLFWFVYSFTENIVAAIGITAGVSINTLSILYMLGKRKKS